MKTIIPLTCLKTGNTTLDPEQVFYITDEEMSKVKPVKGGGSIFKVDKAQYEVREKPLEIQVIRNPESTNPILASKISALTPVGDPGVAITNFFSETSGGTVTSADAAQLPAATGSKRVLVLVNSCTFPLQLTPQSGESINALANDVQLAIPVNARIHIVDHAVGNWRVATDNG